MLLLHMNVMSLEFGSLVFLTGLVQIAQESTMYCFVTTLSFLVRDLRVQYARAPYRMVSLCEFCFQFVP